MRLGVLKEPDGENRVSVIPNSYKKLNKLGFELTVESGAGEISHYSDNEYQSAGFTVSDKTSVLESEIVVSISMPLTFQMPKKVRYLSAFQILSEILAWLNRLLKRKSP